MMKYIIIGGDAAGMSAAMQLLKHDKEAEITILERGEYYSYAQCGIPYVVSGDIASKDKLIVRKAETYRDKFGMDARTNHEVTSIDPAKKIVCGVNLQTDEKFELTYDKLLIATGADANIPKWSGMRFKNVFTLKDIPDLEKIMTELDGNVKKVTIIGGGYIGLEMAEAFNRIGKEVTVINRGNQVANMFDADMTSYIEAEAEKHGIEFVYGEDTKEITGDEKAEFVITDKGKHATDLVLISIGVTPNTAFLQETDVNQAKNGAVLTNDFMETNVTDIYAAGDCATQYHRVKKKFDFVPLGTHANKQGRIAGINMTGQKRIFKGIVGSSIMKFLDLSLGKTGLSAKEAERLELHYKTVSITTRHIAGYYPGAKKLRIKLVYHKKTRELLGGQVIGEAGVDKRIDVLAVAIFNKMKINDLEDLDLSYAPPYNGVWDPIQRAARKANK